MESCDGVNSLKNFSTFPLHARGVACLQLGFSTIVDSPPPESQLRPLKSVPEEARETDRLIKRHINTTRYLLLDMRDRKGWKALGYESFVEYGEKELSLGSARIYQLADAAEISLQLGFSKILEKQPTESHLVPLKSVPEEDRKAIWEEATRAREHQLASNTHRSAYVRPTRAREHLHARATVAALMN